MNIRRWTLIIAFVVVWNSVFVSPHAASPLNLTPEIQRHLIALESLRKPEIDRSIFDGRPILVKFFASW